eukprot:g6234.t1
MNYKIKIDEITQEISTDEHFEMFLDQCKKFIEQVRIKVENDTKKQNSQQQINRIIIGVVGGAGAGKSSFCSIIENLLYREACGDKKIESGNNSTYDKKAITVSMDGYHFTNKYLDSNFISGTTKTLRTIKGDLLSIDAESIYNDLLKLKDVNNNETSKTEDGKVLTLEKKVYFPVYDRNLHDPVPNKICVEPYHEIVFFEGLHLLTNDNSYWDKIKLLLNGLIVLNTAVDVCKERVIKRRVTQGKTKDAATKHWANNDLHIHQRIHKSIEKEMNNGHFQNIPILLLHPGK